MEPVKMEGSAASRPAPLADPKAALGAMYDAHLRDVWHALRRHGVADRDLEDAAHEVFVIAWRRLVDFDPSRPPRPWLCGIAWRVAAAWRRSGRVRLEQVGLAFEPVSPSPDGGADAAAIVHAALAALPAPQRDVFVLHELDGLTMPEIEALTEAPLNTLYSRLRLARARFADQVRSMSIEEDYHGSHVPG